MRDALLRDLSQLPYAVITTVDARLASPVLVSGVIELSMHDDVWQVWQAAIKNADAVWLIAPETDGLLQKLTALAVKCDKKIIGCGLKSIEIASSKLATYQALQQAGIKTIPTFTLENWQKDLGENRGKWLTKPDDGAGCEETFFFANAADLIGLGGIWNKARRHIIQPFITGKSASICCVMHGGKAQVLSCNAQIIEIKNNQLSYHGSIVNGMREHWAAFEMVANKIAQAMPDLAAYVGIDVIVENGEVSVVEINPRLTTSYVGLAEATGVNPAELILNTLMQENYPWPKLEQNVVTINV